MDREWVYSLYPDKEPPDLDDPATDKYDRAEYVYLLCKQMDYGLLPTGPEIEALRDWQTIFDEFPVLGSRSYHSFRAFFGWPPMATNYLSTNPARFQVLDEHEGREADLAVA